MNRRHFAVAALVAAATAVPYALRGEDTAAYVAHGWGTSTSMPG